MIKFYVAILCCLWTESLTAQVDVVDSLRIAIQLSSHPDTNRVNVLNALSYEYQWLDFNRSLEYADKALALAESLSYQKGIATACSRQAQSSWSLGDSERAMEKALRAVIIAEKEDLTNVLAETYRIMAVSYRDQLDLDKAAYFVRKAEQLAMQEKDWDLLARIYNAAGVIAYSRNLTDSARTYYNKSLQLSEEHTTRRFHLSQVISNMGETYLAEDPDKALRYFIEALKSAKETHNRPAEAGIMGDIGRAYILKENYEEADRYLNQSLKLARGLGLKRISRYANYALADLKLKEGKTSEAFGYMQAYYDVRDSLLNAAQTRDIVELETRFEKEKQEQKIALLEQEHRTERLWNNALLLGTLIIVIAIGIIVRLQRLRSVKAKQLLRAQQALNEQLKETDSMKSRFFANISHEFRTPLTLIIGPLEAQMKNSKLSDAEQKDLKIVQRNAYRLLDLVNQLLDLSKIEARKMELSVANGDLTEFLNVLTASFESLAEHKNIAFLRNIATIENPVSFDKDKIEKIVTNILFNAFKFTPTGGQVAISAHFISDKKELVVCVADTGIGIRPEEQSMVFSPFYQLGYDNEDGHTGTGLGLSLVNELVKLYGGTIKLLSELNKGTCITITLPVFHISNSNQQTNTNVLVQKPLLPVADEQHDEPADLSGEAETILLVEDNIELRSFIASGLENRFRIIMAIDGEHGLAKAQEYIPDVIISDVMMPRMNGMEFMKRIREDERTSHIPTILLTARADDESRIEGLKIGADEYLPKPFLMNELKIRVNNVLLQRRRLAAKLKGELMQLKSTLPQNTEPSLDEKFIIRLTSTTEENLSNPLFSVEMLAEKMNLSRAHLFRKVKAIINMSPSEFINDLRLQRAAQLIRSKADNVSQIGYSVGYNEQSYFSKRFRKKFGVSPTDYAKQNVVQQDYL